MEAKASSKYRDLKKEDLEPSKIIVVSSAYWDNLHSVSKIFFPWTSLSFLMVLTKCLAALCQLSVVVVVVLIF